MTPLVGLRKLVGCWGRLALPCLLLAVGCSGPAQAGEQAERALAAVKSLITQKKIDPALPLTILAKEGNVQNVWGKDFEIKNEWEKKTGIRIETRTRQNLPVFDEMLKSRNFDLTLSRQREYPDLYTNGLIADLSSFVKAHGLVFDRGPQGAYLAPGAQTEFAGRTVAIPADGDIALLYLRRDLMEDPERKKAFRRRYGRDLAPPDTWAEYDDLVEFFHDPKAELYGSIEQRDPANGWMFWMPRYVSQNAPQRFLFDERMGPLIDSPEGVAATESYLKTVRFSPPLITDAKSDYGYTVPLYRSGKGFAIIQTLALAKMLNGESSPVRGKFVCVPMPGTKTGGTVVRRTSFIYGNNLVVSRASPHPELAFLFAMWFTDPDVSLRSIRMTSGLADPYRENHLKDPGVWQIYTREAVDALAAHARIAVPEGTGVPGDHEYMKALSANLWEAATGKITASQAMARTAAAWEAITERYGRDSQIRYWKAFRRVFPP